MVLKILIVFGLLLFFVGSLWILEKIRNKHIQKTITRVSKEAVNKSVAEGNITRKQGDAIIWLLHEYKPLKNKK